MKRMSVTFTDAQHKKLQVQSENTGNSMNSIIRNAVNQYVKVDEE